MGLFPGLSEIIPAFRECLLQLMHSPHFLVGTLLLCTPRRAPLCLTCINCHRVFLDPSQAL